MKTEEQIKLRISALKMELEYKEKTRKLKPFEASRLNYMIRALEWVINGEKCDYCKKTFDTKKELGNHDCAILKTEMDV